MTLDERTCHHCGGPMTGRARQARYCSHTCKQYAYYERNPDARAQIDVAAAARRSERLIGPTLAPRVCAACGTTFQPAQRRSRFCSKRCGRRAG